VKQPIKFPELTTHDHIIGILTVAVSAADRRHADYNKFRQVIIRQLADSDRCSTKSHGMMGVKTPQGVRIESVSASYLYVMAHRCDISRELHRR
jgi:hypothetical protein